MNVKTRFGLFLCDPAKQVVLPGLFYPHSKAFGSPDNLELLSSSMLVEGRANIQNNQMRYDQGCIIRLTCSHPKLTKDHVLTSSYVIIF